MEINEVDFHQQNNHSNEKIVNGLEQSKDVLGSYRSCGVRLLNSYNNNNEEGNARQVLKQPQQQLEDRVLFRYVPKHVINSCEPAFEQYREYSSEKSFHSDWLSAATGFIPSSSKLFDCQTLVSTSQTSSLSECSPLIIKNRATAPLPEQTPTSGEVGAVTSEFDSTIENILTAESSEVLGSTVCASGSSEVENSSERQEELPATCKKSTLSYEANLHERKDQSPSPEKPVQPCARAFCDVDEEFEFLKVTPVRRSSSLKSSASSSSLSKKKEVRFADALGLDLESIKHITSTSEPPIVPRKALRDLELGEKSDDSRRSLEQVLQLCPCFSLPGYSPDFAKKVYDRKVMLETLTVDDHNLMVTGLICVANFAYVKRIFVRYTTNGWLTYEDVDASYLGGSSEGRLDKFLFKIMLPSSFGFGSQMEFAISFESASQVYWDNNGKVNYRVMCHLKQVS